MYFTKKHILIIEDTKDFQYLLKKILFLDGFYVETADNGLLALEHLKTSTKLPDVILLDIMMPFMDGYQFRQHQMSDFVLSQIPVIAISADENADLNKLQMNEFHHLKKPLNLEMLIDRINSCLNHSEAKYSLFY
jgi:CheY-like chemotaxis protein